ncbi:nitrogen fixation protein NifQ [Pseudooceanicola nanhaiensis]|uniref:nitrogen fixation protein NifQ n=1 Tax=Pseudooceanicola nanhaiensis TaxID=375761 RepID=UPI001CD2C81B|nr:nitrogen fixation protein NifQ [Pseudooceanicola nanhaiensis]MCA0920175.1 nitrogen fixation protein NifQ [Pseudooceanicola nanhaiensis]
MQPWTDPVPGSCAGTPPPADLLAARMVTVSDMACIVDHALAEREAGAGPLTERLGLSGAALTQLRDAWLPGAALPDLSLPGPEVPADQQAIATLILWRAGSTTPEARWFSAILARRALEQNHLWQDLGLPSRATLSGLIARHLPGLHAANRLNMRWKKFFYRQICSEAAFSLCLSPSCDACEERADCFAPE